MNALKKYGAVLLLILAFPMIRFIANNFMLESSNAIYSYIPQESDFVIEINTRNFINEIAYQRIYEETYFMDQVYPETDEEPEEKAIDTGLDLFNKVILFREQWANEPIWIALLKYNDREKLESFILEGTPNANFEFNDEYVVVQLSNSSDQERLNEHLKKISRKEIKAFSERVNLSKVFDPKKEINCYVFPATTPQNQLIDGYFSFDFLTDHIAIEGAFTPLLGLSEIKPIAYSRNPDEALSIRSSLNLFNSISWFNGEKIENLPEYSQMTFDYNGVECRLVHKKMGFSTPFKSYPDLSVHFDIAQEEVWQSFFDSLKIKNGILLDTLTQTLYTAEGTHLNYAISNNSFELMQDTVLLTKSDVPNLYLDFRMNVDPMIDNTVFTVDEKNPPSIMEQKLGKVVGGKIMDEIRVLANMEWIEFQLTGNESDEIIANGKIAMKEKNGHSMVESLSFGSAAFTFVKNY